MESTADRYEPQNRILMYPDSIGRRINFIYLISTHCSTDDTSIPG